MIDKPFIGLLRKQGDSWQVTVPKDFVLENKLDVGTKYWFQVLDEVRPPQGQGFQDA